ncbi:hypothetical protein [Enterobacter ludwigii]|uniref:hypothetical protein n=1 Tax=Enterobacter ludwigii TaxID=299767 RepID=UPI00307661C4
MIPFKWTPKAPMAFSVENETQVLTSGNYDITTGGSLSVDARDERLILRNAKELNWAADTVYISNGTIEVFLNGIKPASTDQRININALTTIGGKAGDACLSIYDAGKASSSSTTALLFSGDDIKILNNGTFNIGLTAPDTTADLSGKWELSGNAILDVDVSSRNDGLLRTESAEIILSLHSKLFLNSPIIGTAKISLTDEASAIIVTDEFYPSEASISLAGNSTVHLGSLTPGKLVIPQKAGLFNMASDGTPTIALYGIDPLANGPIATGFGQKWLEDNHIIYVGGKPAAKGVLKFDFASQDGIMLVSI